MFDIEKMMEYERKSAENMEKTGCSYEPAYVRSVAMEEVNITMDRIDGYIRFITSHIHFLNQTIIEVEKKGKDITPYVKHRNRALKALGLIE